ncbi:hypothetical protein [Emcibacter sp. SYSU 3D8]|uniref:hypothetical protein n=1 Tax=Emcibacter sp. SYSU 3D8 TaxID=3133969 RepID=UPI0031FF29D5
MPHEHYDSDGELLVRSLCWLAIWAGQVLWLTVGPDHRLTIAVISVFTGLISLLAIACYKDPILYRLTISSQVSPERFLSNLMLMAFCSGFGTFSLYIFYQWKALSDGDFGFREIIFVVHLPLLLAMMRIATIVGWRRLSKPG